MLLTAALTSLALLAPLSAPSTIEVTRTTTRDGNWVRVEDSVRVDETHWSRGFTTVNCESDVRNALCDGFEQLPDVRIRVARTKDDGTIRITEETRVGDAVGGAGTTVNCGGGITAGAVCTVYDVIDAVGR